MPGSFHRRRAVRRLPAKRHPEQAGAAYVSAPAARLRKTCRFGMGLALLLPRSVMPATVTASPDAAQSKAIAIADRFRQARCAPLPSPRHRWGLRNPIRQAVSSNFVIRIAAALSSRCLHVADGEHAVCEFSGSPRAVIPKASAHRFAEPVQWLWDSLRANVMPDPGEARASRRNAAEREPCETLSSGSCGHAYCVRDWPRPSA